MRKLINIRGLIISGILFFVVSIVIVFSFSFSKENNSPSPTSGNWTLQTNLQTFLNGRTISDMTFIDSLTGFAVTPYVNGDSSFIFKSSNGGFNWSIVLKQSSYYGGFNKISFINNTTGFTCGNYVMKTTDKGNSWFNISPIGLNAISMSVLSIDTIYISNYDQFAGGVFRTTNGGQNWQQLYNAGNDNPNSIYMVNGKISFYSGGVRKLFKTYDGGFNWTSIYDSASVTDYHFYDTLTGYIASEGIVKKTTNGGMNWIRQSMPLVPGSISTYYIRRFYFGITDTIWAVGGMIQNPNTFQNKGIINKTIDGGSHWGYQLPDTHNIPIRVYNFISFFNQKIGWSYIGLGSGVYTNTGDYDTTLYVGISESNNNIIPEKYKLSQNYPNPFNPITKIKFEIPKVPLNKGGSPQNADMGLLTILKIFDIQGKEICTLVNEKLRSGEYTATFDGRFLPSGVYIYSLLFNNKIIESKKAILLK